MNIVNQPASRPKTVSCRNLEQGQLYRWHGNGNKLIFSEFAIGEERYHFTCIETGDNWTGTHNKYSGTWEFVAVDAEVVVRGDL